MRKKRDGFTITELIIVIVIIGILTTISILSYSKIQASTRDSQRQAKATVLAEALEKYYDKNGEYPSCSAMSAPATTVASTTLKGIDPTSLIAPTAPSGTQTSIQAACASLSVGTDAIAYVGDNSITCTSTDCLQFTIQYYDESTGTIATIASRRKTNIATSGNITDLGAFAVTFTQLNLNWTAVSNATGYTVQQATNSGFTANLTSSTVASNPTTMIGLSAGVTYWFRVQPNFTSGSGSWSNTVTATTLSLSAPVISATTFSYTQINVSWAAVTNAQTYNIDQSTSSSFTSPTTITGIVTTSYAATGLTSGTTYYYRVRAVASSQSSSNSNTASAIALILPAPVASSTVNSPHQVTLNWNSIAMAQSYTVNASTSSSFTSPIVATGVSGTSYAFSGLAPATIYYFRVQPVAYGVNGSWSNTAGSTTTISAPAAPSMSAYISGGSSVGAAGGVSCDGGTPYYQIDYNINDGGINYPSYSTSSSISFGVNEDTKIGYWVYAYCQGPSASSGAVGGNYASTVRGIDTPGAPGMAAYISGGTAVGYVSSGVGCAAGSVQYQVPYNVNDGGMNWPGYWNGSSMSVGAGEGNKYGFWGYAYCQGTYSSSASNGGNYASAVRGIDVPSAPGFLGPWTMHSTSIYTLSWSTNCQGGWVVGSWRSQSWSGSNYGPYGWWTGGSDTAGWTNSVGYTRNVYYWGKYYCQSSYTNSGWSGESGPYTVGVTTT